MLKSIQPKDGQGTNPTMKLMTSAAFRKWVCTRFGDMADDSTGWARDNRDLVPQARRIEYAASKNEPVSAEDAIAICHEVIQMEDVIRNYEWAGDRKVWEGAKQFLVDTGFVEELTKARAANMTVSSGKLYWFKHKGAMYL